MISPVWRRRLTPWSVFAIAVLLLVPFIALDPARGLTFSNAPFSDEAWNLMGARNIVLFGHPSTDEWRTWLLATPFTAVQAVALAMLGLDLSVARLVIIVSVALTGTGIAAVLRDRVGALAAWIAGVAYVTSALVLYYGRLAFLEPLVGAFLATAVLSLVPAARNHALRWGMLGGLALALAVMTKGLAAPAAAAVMLVLLLAAVRVPWARRWLLGAVPVAAGAAAIWGLLVLWPNRRGVATVIGTIYPPFQLPADLASAWQQIAAFPTADNALGLALPLVILGLVAAGRVLWLVRRNGLPGVEAAIVPLAAGAALLASLGLLSVVDYQPNRYVVAFLPLAAVLAAWAFPARVPGLPSNGWVLKLAVAGLAAAPGLVLHFGALRPTGSEVATIQGVLGDLPAGSTIVGQYAPLVGFGTTARTVVPFETVNDADQYAAGARYVVWIDEGPAWMTSKHAAAWAARETLACMTWGKVPVRSCVYRLLDPGPP